MHETRNSWTSTSSSEPRAVARRRAARVTFSAVGDLARIVSAASLAAGSPSASSRSTISSTVPAA